MFALLDDLDLELVMRSKTLYFKSMEELDKEALARINKYEAEGKKVRFIVTIPGYAYQIQEIPEKVTKKRRSK